MATEADPRTVDLGPDVVCAIDGRHWPCGVSGHQTVTLDKSRVPATEKGAPRE